MTLTPFLCYCLAHAHDVNAVPHCRRRHSREGLGSQAASGWAYASSHPGSPGICPWTGATDRHAL
eukprot:3712282-Rhodomonas_salina.2